MELAAAEPSCVHRKPARLSGARLLKRVFEQRLRSARHEAVTHPGLGAQPARLRRVGLDLIAQVGHLHTHGQDRAHQAGPHARHLSC